MKKYIIALALVLTTIVAHAQNETTSKDMQEDLQQVLKPTYGDYYEGLSKKITFDRMIPPYGLEVTFEKTVHVIFPAAIRYVDLGSNNIIAGKAGSSENVLRIKSAVRSFETETNMAVITEEGSYYTFNIKYADEPEKLNIEMKDFMHDGIATNRPNNSMEIYLKELGSESPRIVYLINRSIYQNDKRIVKHIGSKRFGIQYLLKGIYSHNGLLYLHTQIKNSTNVPFDIDFIRFKIIDKKMVKQTAVQETVIHPLRVYNFISQVGANQTERTVFTIDKITIPNDKQLVIELFEKNGGRNQTFVIENNDLIRAEQINELKIK
ncbi:MULTISPECIES: conjugative transposon protein TraN [Dysgonomonas]|uniref:conjugative transposon protein TraN n=1 Tax=Dysgonomonas TaxID=156973 RepID=UPI00092B0577|nr:MULTISPECIES: conjugative transposon protein TraN [Dysgonomonas]MBN9300765.1 conjugative transposon protein TraN [Dysgonomonas mossii]OJX61957.1 MAG: conjugative transposon protein TraN [Dysgonomonas sp. 37-18]